MRKSPARSLPFIVLASLTVMGLSACDRAKPQPVITAKIVDEIKADEVHWNSDYRSGDPGKVASHYAAHATVMMPGVAPLVGAPAIRAALEEAYQDPHFGVSFSSDRVDVATSGDLAATRGTWRQTTTDPATKHPVVATGTFVTVYKPQADGKWRAVWDILSPSPVPTAPAGAEANPAG